QRAVIDPHRDEGNAFLAFLDRLRPDLLLFRRQHLLSRLRLDLTVDGLVSHRQISDLTFADHSLELAVVNRLGRRRSKIVLQEKKQNQSNEEVTDGKLLLPLVHS